MGLLSRILYRQPAPRRVRSLDAATGGRRGQGMGMFAAVNSEVAASAPLVARRAAYLATNDPLLSNGVGNLSSYLVGTGARPVVRIDDRAQRRAVGRRFDEWADVADHAGRTDFYGLQAILARDLIVHGEALALMHDDDEGLRLQVLPPDHLNHV